MQGMGGYVTDLGLDEEQRAVVELARRIGLEVLDPAAREADRTGQVPEKVWRTLLDTGLVTTVPARFGGGGLAGTYTWLVGVEELAYGDPGITAAAVWQAAAALLITLSGTEEQAVALLPALGGDPDLYSGVALYEGFGRAPSEFATVLRREGERWRLAGRKAAVPFARRPDLLIVVGVDPDVGCLRAAVVDSDWAGSARFEGSSGRLGLGAAVCSSVSVDGLVDGSSLLGGPDGDPAALGDGVGRVRLAVAACAVGAARRAVDYAAAYATERVAFARPIAAFQGVSFLLAEAQIRLGAVRAEVADVASRLDGKRSSGVEMQVTRAVNHAGQVSTSVTRDALQVMGGHGFISDHPVERWYRAAATLAALDFDPLCSALELGT
jgi:alkylation response protein AidB-like acyl-CoA dehydrogenase